MRDVVQPVKILCNHIAEHGTTRDARIYSSERKVTTQMIRAWRSERLEQGTTISVVAKAYRFLRAVLMTAAEEDKLISPTRAGSRVRTMSTHPNDP